MGGSIGLRASVHEVQLEDAKATGCYYGSWKALHKLMYRGIGLLMTVAESLVAHDFVRLTSPRVTQLQPTKTR